MMDEWGYFESSLMGHPVLETPNIDRFAAEGMRFTQVLAGGNVCAPTRSTLMSRSAHGAHDRAQQRRRRGSSRGRPHGG
jgi:arylsulfatase A-like enzyme